MTSPLLTAQEVAARKAYSLKQAAALIGMSIYWLRDRLDTPELSHIKFRTSGDSGHWRLRAAPYERFAARFNSGRVAFGKTAAPTKRPTRERKTAQPAQRMSLMQIYRESKARQHG